MSLFNPMTMKQPEDTKTADLLEAAPKRGRKPAPSAEIVTDVVSPEVARQASQAATEVVLMDAAAAERATALALQVGYEGSMEIGALEDGIRFYQRRTVEACMELGKRLLLLKEVTPHGEFRQRIEMLGVNQRMGQRFMAATLKFARGDAQPLLLAAGTQTKLLELVVLDDEEIDALATDGAIGELELDDVAAMSVTELRAALREHKAQVAAKDRVIDDKNKRIDGLEEKLARPFKPAPNAAAQSEAEQAHINGLREAITAAELAFARVAVAVATVRESGPTQPMSQACDDGVSYLIARVKDMVDTHQLNADTSDESFGLKPEWM